MRSKRVYLELPNYYVTISFRPKGPPKAGNDNKKFDFWSEELQELYDRYDK